MRIALLSIIFISTLLNLEAQGPPPPPGFDCIILETQQDVDDFPTNYPGQTEVDCIELRGSTIDNLDGLSQIEILGGILFNNVVNISDVSGLSQITVLDLGMVIQNYTSNIEFFATLSDFNNISTVRSLIIENNTDLHQLFALYYLDEILSQISIRDNADLTSLTGIGGALLNQSQFNFLAIQDNPNLTECEINNLCNYLVNAPVQNNMISGNGTGCDSEAEIITSCSGCPIGPVILSSQAEVDAFGTIHASCTNVETLAISGADIVDLTPLNNLTQVAYMGISDNPMLTSLNGLENIAILESPPSQGGVALTIDNNPLLTSLAPLSGMVNTEPVDISISNNPLITDLNGLQGMNGIVYTFYIAENDSMVSLEGIENIDNADDFYIYNNPSLVNFEGASGVEGIGGLSVFNNDALVSFEGFVDVDPLCGLDIRDNLMLSDIDYLTDTFTNSCGANFIIEDNPELAYCSMNFVCEALPFADTISISNNAPGCNSQVEVETACNAPLCPSEDITLATQAEVDAFAANYPNCTELTNVFVISGGDITDLSGLSQITASTNLFDINANPNLTTISGLGPITFNGLGTLKVRNNAVLQSLSTFSGVVTQVDNIFTGVLIENNPQLTSLAGLEGITEAFALEIKSNAMLADLSGLDGLVNVIEEVQILNNQSLQTLEHLNLEGSLLLLTINGNESLVDLEGLNAIETIGSVIVISGNAALESLNGLQGITNPDGDFPFLEITSNDALTDISAIGNFEITSLTISNNPLLSECEISNICAFIDEFPNDALIENNAAGCDSVPEVQAACEALSVADSDFENSISIFPNPASEFIEIIVSEEIEFRNITIYSVLGTSVLTSSKTVIDLSSISEGIYFMQIQTNKGFLTKRLVKEY